MFSTPALERTTNPLIVVLPTKVAQQKKATCKEASPHLAEASKPQECSCEAILGMCIMFQSSDSTCHDAMICDPVCSYHRPGKHTLSTVSYPEAQVL